MTTISAAPANPHTIGKSTCSDERRGAERDLSILVAGEILHLLPQRAIWWPRRRTLLVADLHLGKEEAFLSLGVPMPANVLDETLARLGSVVVSHGATRVVVLGDLIHARAGISPEIAARVAAWRETLSCEVDLVPGNHDEHLPALPPEWRVNRLTRAVLDPPFLHMHDARPHSGGFATFTWGGHLHPVVAIEGRIDRLVLPCFVVGARRGILPAFTAFSRGARISPEPGDRIYAVADGSVVELTLSAPRG